MKGPGNLGKEEEDSSSVGGTGDAAKNLVSMTSLSHLGGGKM